MNRHRSFAVALALAVLVLAAPAFAQPCDQYDDGSLRPPSDPNPEVACGGRCPRRNHVPIFCGRSLADICRRLVAR